MDIMEVDNQEASTSTVIEPVEGISVTNDKHAALTFQTTTIKNDLNAPWFVHLCIILITNPTNIFQIPILYMDTGLKNTGPKRSQTLLGMKKLCYDCKNSLLVEMCQIL